MYSLPARLAAASDWSHRAVDVAAEMTIFAEIGIHKYRNKNETFYRYIDEKKFGEKVDAKKI